MRALRIIWKRTRMTDGDLKQARTPAPAPAPAPAPLPVPFNDDDDDDLESFLDSVI